MTTTSCATTRSCRVSRRRSKANSGSISRENPASIGSRLGRKAPSVSSPRPPSRPMAVSNTASLSTRFRTRSALASSFSTCRISRAFRGSSTGITAPSRRGTSCPSPSGNSGTSAGTTCCWSLPTLWKRRGIDVSFPSSSSFKSRRSSSMLGRKPTTTSDTSPPVASWTLTPSADWLSLPRKPGALIAYSTSCFGSGRWGEASA